VIVRLGVLGVAVGLGACSRTTTERAVIAQNVENTALLAANLAALEDATRESVRVQTATMVRRSRERVANDLTRIRASIIPSAPTDAEVTDASSAWALALQRETDALRERVTSVPPEDRPAVARALADDHPATIDAAMESAGFDIARVLRDAITLDRANAMIDAEPNASVRAGLLARRDAILDAYLPARAASEAADRYRQAVEKYLATIDEQASIAGLHARALQAASDANPWMRSISSIAGDQDVRALALDIIARQWGAQTAADVRERLDRAVDALDGIAGVINGK
jgi:enamine deaminase RidA (YjgF/YER057c/UK114 family)